MLGRSCIVFVALCGCAGLGPVTGWESRPLLASPLAGYGRGYAQEEEGGWDARIGAVLPYADGTLFPVGLRTDLIWVKYFKAETFSVEPGFGAYVLLDERGEENGQLLVVPVTCVAKYFFELIYKSGLKIYLGTGLGLYYGQSINSPEVALSDVALAVPFCLGVQLAPEERTAIEIEFRFDTPVFDAEAKEPGLPIWRPGDADLSVTFISVNWKGVF